MIRGLFIWRSTLHLAACFRTHIRARPPGYDYALYLLCVQITKGSRDPDMQERRRQDSAALGGGRGADGSGTAAAGRSTAGAGTATNSGIASG